MKKLGIIGGLGPAASGYFFRRVTALTKAEHDRQHIEVILYSRPSIPDRSAFITGTSPESPLSAILEVAGVLDSLNADYIALPCVTAHYFIDEIRAACNAVVIDMVQETTEYLAQNGVKSAAILATDGTISAGFLSASLEKKGIIPVIPSPERQADVMEIIKNIKAGKPANGDIIAGIIAHCRNYGAEAILAACTELSLIKSPDITDCTEILARRAVTLCGAELAE